MALDLDCVVSAAVWMCTCRCVGISCVLFFSRPLHNFLLLFCVATKKKGVLTVVDLGGGLWLSNSYSAECCPPRKPLVFCM